MAAAGYQGDWSGYVYAEQQLAYPVQYLQQSTQEYDVLADPSISQDPRFMTQADKDRGLGSVFKRDDQRLNQLREKDARERDPNFISDSYSECYPGYQEYNNEIAGSDDEDDLSKMDMGGRVSDIIRILCIKVSLLMQASACDKGLCEIAVDKHHLVNIYQSAVAFELICTDNSFLLLFSLFI